MMMTTSLLASLARHTHSHLLAVPYKCHPEGHGLLAGPLTYGLSVIIHRTSEYLICACHDLTEPQSEYLRDDPTASATLSSDRPTVIVYFRVYDDAQLRSHRLGLRVAVCNEYNLNSRNQPDSPLQGQLTLFIDTTHSRHARTTGAKLQ